MIKTAWNYLVRPERTVDTITAPLQTMVMDLTKLHEDMLKQSENYLAEAERYRQMSSEAAHEAANAEIVAGKIEALFS